MTSDARQAAVQRELAARVLSRRRLLPFIQRLNPKYLAGWVHEDICQRLERFSEAVAAGASPRLMLLMPPRHGKSEIASKNFPAWHMGRYPDHEFIACSYNLSLAMGFSRKVKQLLDDPLYQSVFEGTRLDPNNQSTEEWGIAGRRGAYVAAGIGGPITGKGAHCVVPYSTVDTRHGDIPISQLKVGDEVYGYNHLTGQIELTRIRGVVASSRAGKKLVRIGDTVVTEDHRVYTTTDGYTAAVASQGMRGLRREEGAAGPYVQSLSPEGACTERHAADMRLLQPEVHAEQGRDRQGECQSRPDDAGLLQSAVLHEVQAGASRGLQQDPWKLQGLRESADRQGAHQILLPRELPGISGEAQGYGSVWVGVAVASSDGGEAGQGVPAVRGEDRQDGDPSHGPQSCEQRYDEHGVPVQPVPQAVSLVHGTCAADLAGLLDEADYVVDIQTGLANFFCAGLLIHNCLLIDDPIKNAEEADSADSREKTWEWYLSTAYSRLAPGGGVLCIQTWWHDDDLAGRLQQMMAQGGDEDFIDQFEVVKYPAIAEADEWLDTDSSQILRIEHLTAADDPAQAAARLTRAGHDPQVCRLLRMKGEALHPARYDVDKLLRIKAQNKGGRWWSALYQQNPVPDDGAYFTKDQFRRGAPPSVRSANVFIAFDFAISEKKQNDYTVGTVALQDDDDVLHVADVLRFKSGDAFFIVEAILNLATRWYSPSLTMGFEDGQIWRAIEALLRKRMKERQFYPSITVLKPITDKLARARVIQGRMQQGMVSFSTEGDWYDTVRQEMLRFPAGVHDDCVDSLAWVAQMAVGRMAPRKPKATRNESWKDRLISGPRGSGHMAA